jgi:hypothetical protein
MRTKRKEFTQKDAINQVERGSEIPEPQGRLLIQETQRGEVLELKGRLR